jgi:para-nitrobenzyl esterase
VSASASIVDTPFGRVAGKALDGATAFLGLPYAAAPIGASRLRSPRPPTPWTGTRDATRAGPASLQTLGGNQRWLYEPIAAQSEDCLFLNVWTPDVAGSRPVLVWVHGGQTRNGHGAAAAFDGTALAKDHGIVVVTINYRLGALGGLAHPELEDETTGCCANWGLQDKLAALEWVRDCIAAFGGDAGNVTLAGQSSGAANVALIAQNGLARERYRRIILQSPPLFRPPMFVELAAAAEYTALLAEKLGVAVRGLRELDGTVIQRAEHALAGSPEVASRMGRPRTAPVRDGRLIRAWSYDAEPPACAMLAGWTRDEANFWFDLHDADGAMLTTTAPPRTAGEFEARVAKLVELQHAFPDLPVHEWTAPAYDAAADVVHAWTALYTDLVFRAPILHLAGRHARAGRPAWLYEFAYPLPPPGRGAPHASDVPFVFGTVEAAHLRGKIGTAPAVRAVSDAMMSAWAAFAATGAPAEASIWPAFDPDTPRVMAFGPESAHEEPLQDLNRLGCWPGYAWR